MKLILLTTLAAIFAMPSGVTGQSVLRCLVPFELTPSTDGCQLRASGETNRTLIVLQLLDVPGQPTSDSTEVKAQITSGSGTLHDWNETPLLDGIITGTLAGPVTNKVTIRVRAGAATREVIVMPTPPESTPVRLSVHSGQDQYWFQGHELLKPVVVRLQAEDSLCSSTPVFFRPISGGKVQFDTVFASMEDGGCLAKTSWTLDERVGHQGLRASTPDNPEGVAFRARSRRGPRVFLGVHLGAEPGFTERRSSPDTAVITTTEDGKQIVRKQIDHNFSAVENDLSPSFDPVIGIDTPIWYTVEQIRISLGTAVDDFNDRWFIGFSVFQPFQGFLQESLALDLHFVLNIVNRDEVVGDTCAQNSCDIDERTDVSAGIMLVTDGTGLVSNLVKVITGG